MSSREFEGENHGIGGIGDDGHNLGSNIDVTLNNMATKTGGCGHGTFQINEMTDG
jgi:hypothetical protein